MFLKTFFRLFPPPFYLDMPFVGLDISDDAVRVMGLRKKRTKIVVNKFYEKKIPENIIEAGYINDEKALIDILKEIKKEINIQNVKISVPEEKMYLFSTDVTAEHESDVRSNIEFKLEENIPIPPSDVIFDFETIQRKNGITSKASVFAFPNKAVEAYMNAVEGAGLRLMSFDLEPRAVARAVLKKHEQGTFIIVKISEKRTGVYIVSNNVPRFSSTLPFGGSSIIDSFSKLKGIDRGEAKERFNKEAFTDGKNSKEIFDSSINIFSSIRDEIIKVIGYWQSHSDSQSPIKEIILCGKGSMICGVSEYFSSQLKIKVRGGNVWSNIIGDSEVPPIPKKDATDFATAIGLALSD